MQYVPIELAERLESYRPGGYHPVLVGDVLHSKYRVVHKLGHGNFSTIWLCRDEEAKRYVALKVGIAEFTSNEPEMLDFLNSPPSPEPEKSRRPGRAMIPEVLDRFVVEGPSGSHPCLATTPALCSIQDSLEDETPFPLDTARSLTVQIILALDYIHSRGVVHGDLHPANLLLCPQGNEFDKLSVEEFHEKHPLGEPEPINRIDGQPLGPGVPPHVVIPAWLGKYPDECLLSETRVMVSDFGSAFRMAADSMQKTNPPLGFVSPEVVLGEGKCITPKADIWALAINIWEILSSRRLFQDNWFQTPEDMIYQWVAVLGKLPPDWWDKWGARSEYFDDEGVSVKPKNWALSLDQAFEEELQETRREKGLETVGDEEATALKAMLRSMLAYKPEDRPTAEELLRCEWVVKWALPDFKRSPYGPLLVAEACGEVAPSEETEAAGQIGISETAKISEVIGAPETASTSQDAECPEKTENLGVGEITGTTEPSEAAEISEKMEISENPEICESEEMPKMEISEKEASDGTECSGDAGAAAAGEAFDEAATSEKVVVSG